VGPRRSAARGIRAGICGCGACPGGASGAFAFDFGWKFTFGNGSDAARDLGFGMDQGDFAKTGDFGFSKARRAVHWHRWTPHATQTVQSLL
jgi:hypothetical protein